MIYTLKQCAKLAELGESTARFYRDRYEQYFSVASGEGRSRKYSQETINLLQFISKCYNDKMDHSQIIEALDNLCGVPISTQIAENSNTNAIQQEDLVKSIKLIFIDELNKRDSLILDLQEELEGIKQALAEQAERAEDSARRLEERDRDITQRLRDITTAQEQRNKEKVPWYRRLLNLDK